MRFGFLRALHLNIFEQPQNMGLFNDPNTRNYFRKKEILQVA